MTKASLMIFAILIAFALNSPCAFSADKAVAAKTGENSKVAEGTEPGLEKVNVDAIKEKYWARGEESELGVVQNRLYSKEHKFEFGLLTGVTSTDPFLAVKTLGAHLGFHFSEYFSFQIVGWKDFVSDSSAIQAFRDTGIGGANVNTNPPQWYLGLEATASIIYGKLSLVGRSIIYYDLYFHGGLGATKTLNGTFITPELGLGQRFFLTKLLSLRFDYRMMYYNEPVIERIVPTPGVYGTVKGYRSNFSHSIMIGVDFLLGGSPKK